MKTLTLCLILLTGLYANTAFAQDNFSLKGEWKSEIKGEEYSSIYEFKKEQEQTVGYSIKIIDKSGSSLSDNTKVLEQIVFTGKKGTANYNFKWEGQTYDLKCSLNVISPDSILVMYNGYDKRYYETWTRIKEE
ncbi:MAG: hypothetical protein N4A59_14185 [Marinifilum sp.]|jgi:hypothetical protein|nr:hypothetical protein [Marinifilum sp.]